MAGAGDFRDTPAVVAARHGHVKRAARPYAGERCLPPPQRVCDREQSLWLSPILELDDIRSK